jgi:Kef-type K+ transport system membrane component KefB/nucleotide-binding universal stress UspA family protein
MLRAFLPGPRLLPAVLLLVVALALGGAAYAAEGGGKPSESLFLLQLLVLVIAGRLLGELMQRLGQPSVMGQLIAGLLLGPSVLGALFPAAEHMLFPSAAAQKSMVDAVGQVGVLLLLLLAGMETDLRLARRTGRASLAVSVTGIVLPFACGFALGLYLPDSLLPDPAERFAGALLLGTALSISSVKIVAMVVREMNFMRRNIGQVILASAVIDDTIGWIIIAVTLSLVEGGAVDLATVTRAVAGTLIFLAISFTIGRRVVFWLIRWTNDTFESELPVISLVLALTFGMALITQAIGVHTVLGAFVAGILIGESPILTRQIDQQLRALITGLFAPVFFGLAGLTADLTILKDPEILMLTAGLVLIATVGKFSGAFIGGKLGGLRLPESLAIACGMNARGSTEVIVATIGLSMGVLSQNLFTMIVAMAILTTLAMPPMLRWALGRLPMREEERQRIEREEFEAKGFMPNVERLLLAVDDSGNGRFAAHLTGLLAGRRGTPTTLLRLKEEAAEAPGAAQEAAASAEPAVDHEADLRAGAEKARDVNDSEQAAANARAEAEMTTGKDPDEGSPKAVVEATRGKPAAKSETPSLAVKKTESVRADAGEAVAKESRKGYDLMVLGIKDTLGPDGALHPDLARLAAGFEGPLGVVLGREPHVGEPTARLSILVPVSGNNVSRRAAEVAVMLARAQDVGITFLYVTARNGRTGGSARLLHPHEQAVLKELVASAERYDTEARVAVRTGVDPEQAILRELKAGRYDFVVMGVNRRPGEALFFGNVAARVIGEAEASIFLLSS